MKIESEAEYELVMTRIKEIMPSSDDIPESEEFKELWAAATVYEDEVYNGERV